MLCSLKWKGPEKMEAQCWSEPSPSSTMEACVCLYVMLETHASCLAVVIINMNSQLVVGHADIFYMWLHHNYLTFLWFCVINPIFISPHRTYVLWKKNRPTSRKLFFCINMSNAGYSGSQKGYACFFSFPLAVSVKVENRCGRER